jgi:hypothetical protein
MAAVQRGLSSLGPTPLSVGDFLVTSEILDATSGNGSATEVQRKCGAVAQNLGWSWGYLRLCINLLFLEVLPHSPGNWGNRVGWEAFTPENGMMLPCISRPLTQDQGVLATTGRCILYFPKKLKTSQQHGRKEVKFKPVNMSFCWGS